jgi:hypothetical protein
VTQDALGGRVLRAAVLVVELLLVLLGHAFHGIEVGPPPPGRGRRPRQCSRDAPRPGLAYPPGGVDPRKTDATALGKRPEDHAALR